MSLTDQHCAPARPGTPPMERAQASHELSELLGWELQGGAGGAPLQIGKRFKFDDFLAAMAFVDKMAALAEEEQHHPDFAVHYNQVDVTLSTHSVGGLSVNDFVMAAKIDAIIA